MRNKRWGLSFVLVFMMLLAISVSPMGISKDAYATTHYKLHYDKNLGTGDVPKDANVEMNKITTVSNCGNLSKTGYIFNGCATDKDGKEGIYEPGSDFNIGTSEKTLYAQWIRGVRLEAEDFKVNSINTHIESNNYAYNKKYMELNGNIENYPKGSVVFENISAIQTVRIRYSSWDGTIYVNGEKFNLTHTRPDGDFLNIQAKFKTVTLNLKTKVEKTLKFEWTGALGTNLDLDCIDILTYPLVTLDANGGQVKVSSLPAIDGKVGTLEIPTRANCNFAGWFTDKTLKNAFNASNIITEDITLYAKWTNTLNATADNGSVTGNAGSYDYGTQVSLVAAPTDNTYGLRGWYNVTGSKHDFLSNDLNYTFNITENLALKAEFAKLMKLTVSTEGSGSGNVKEGGSNVNWTSGSEKSYLDGTKVILTATPSIDSKFDGWNDGSTTLIKGETYTADMNSNKLIKAVFSKKIVNHHVYFVDINNKPIRDYVVSEGTAIEVPAEPFIYGKTFVSWSKSNDEIQKSEEDVTVTPRYDDDYATIDVEAGTGGGRVQVLTRVEVKAPEAGEHQKFSHWQDKFGNIVCYAEEYNFAATYDVSLSAIFVPDTTDVIEEAKIIINDNIKYTSGKLVFTADRVIPEGCKVISHGIILTSDEGIANSEEGFVIDVTGVITGKAKIVLPATQFALVGVYAISKSATRGQTWYAKGYVKYIGKDNKEHMLYSGLKSKKAE
jgi:uncharacterized repeat protein (TIGR02543 family)